MEYMEYTAKEALELLKTRIANNIQTDLGNFYFDERGNLHEDLYIIDKDCVWRMCDSNIIDEEYFLSTYKYETFTAYK